MTIYVDANTLRDGDGTCEHPYKRIGDAAEVAAPGDEVIVAPGVYREYVNPRNAGKPESRITYRSAKMLGAVITGAEEVKNWEPYRGNVWVCRIDNSVFGAYNPYTTYVYGDWYFAGKKRHTGAVYLNDKMLYEACNLDECLKGEVYDCSWEPEASVYKWYSEQDGGETVIYANFQDRNPNKENVEINVRRECFMPAETGIGYITVSGFRVCKAATTWAPPAAYQDGMIGPHWSKGWIIEDCDISNSKCAGISLGKYYDPDNDHYFTTRHVKSPTQMERDAVCRGQYHGWLKERVGSHIIRRCNIHHCEQGGIIGRMGGVFSVIEDNHIHHINNMMELGGAEIAGIKMHAAIDVIYRRNHIHHSTMGIWCDWEAQGTRITQNLFHDNCRPDGARELKGGMMSQDIFVEVGHGPTLIDNNIMLSDVSLRFATQGVALVHNLICGAFTCVGGGTGTRYTPYHIPHRTEVMGFMTILHGDDRFYNNIFVQKQSAKLSEITHREGLSFAPDRAKHRRGNGNIEEENCEVGTHVFDDFITYDEWIKMFDMDSDTPDMHKLAGAHEHSLPVWVDGNAYFNGAKAHKSESHNFVCESRNVKVELVMRDGAPYLSTDLYDALIGFTSGVITSDVLGRAFEPEERYENPDGSAITFDRDYFGDHRDTAPLPGPFCSPRDIEKPLW